jgi:hypothetical protein
VVPAVLDQDLAAEALVPLLLLEDLPHHRAVGVERGVLILAELIGGGAVVEELRHPQLEEGLDQGNVVSLEPLVADPIEIDRVELPVELHAGLVVLQLLDDVVDHLPLELQGGDEAQGVSEAFRGGELPVGLAADHLAQGLEVAVGHLRAGANRLHLGAHRVQPGGDPSP